MNFAMIHPSSPVPFVPARRARQSGSTLLTSLLTVVVLSLVAGNVLSSLSTRYRSAYRSASWNDALLAADAGIDVTLASLTSVIPNVSVSPVSGLGAGYTPLTQLPSVGSLQISPTGTLSVSGAQVTPTGLLTKGSPVLTLDTVSLLHGGEGGTEQHAVVSLEPTTLTALLKGGLGGLNGLLNGNTQLLCLTSTGTVQTSGGRIAGTSRLDNELWRSSLVTDRLTGLAVVGGQANVTRQVQVLLRPVRPYEAAVVSGDALLAVDQGAIFDSFNSTLGPYDSLTQSSHGSVRANGSNVSLGGTVYGDAGTNGGTLPKDRHVTGTVSNAAYTPLPVINPPVWTGNNPAAPASVTGTTSLPSVVLTSLLIPTPAQYRFTGISGSLNITGLPGTTAEVYVDGDLTGGITSAPGVTLKVYVSGSINTSASKLKSSTNVASNLQVYGVYKDATSMPTIRLNADTSLAAAIYAPGHGITLTGGGDFSGSITGARFEAIGPVRVHYDEALAYNAGTPLLRYGIASWKEVLPTTN